MKTFLLLIFCCAMIASTLDAQSHRIGIRTVDNTAEFFDMVTGKKFIPRGNNYIRLANQRKLTGGDLLYHSTFNPGFYDTAQIASALKKMKRSRYNVVRVFLNYACEGGIGGNGTRLSQSYMNNVVDFLQRAKASNIYVMFTIDWLPIPKRITAMGTLWCPDFQCTNAHILTSEGLKANQTFFVQFIKELKARQAPLDILFAYELRNELTFEPHLPPLSASAGIVKTANGKQYNLSLPAEKKKMIDDGLVYWIDQVRLKIRSVDPTALVTVGFIPPKDTETSLKQQKLSITGPAFRNSKMDFIDVHIYPGVDGSTLQEFVDRFGLAGIKNKPIIMGELGAMKQSYPSIEAAARVLRKWQAASKRYGFSGWMLWAWDLHELPEAYNAQDGDETIDRAMAPLYRPDPGAADSPDLAEQNIALNKPVTASHAIAGQPPSNAVDGTSQPWGAGGMAPQWVEINLQRPTKIGMIRLMVSQTPEGKTVHQIWVRGPNEEYRLFREILGKTTDSQILEYPTPGLVNIQFVKVITLQSPSWVGWREIEVIK